MIRNKTDIIYNFIKYEVHSYSNYFGVSGLGLVLNTRYEVNGLGLGILGWGGQLVHTLDN